MDPKSELSAVEVALRQMVTSRRAELRKVEASRAAVEAKLAQAYAVRERLDYKFVAMSQRTPAGRTAAKEARQVLEVLRGVRVTAEEQSSRYSALLERLLTERQKL